MDYGAEVQRVALKQAQSLAFLRGAMVAGAVLLTAVQWYALRQLDELVEQGHAVNRHEQQIAILDVQLRNVQAICVANARPTFDERNPVYEVKRR